MCGYIFWMDSWMDTWNVYCIHIFSSPQHKYVQICRRVFRTLMKISIEELIETADSLIAPVRMGVVRPTAPFALPTNSNIDVSYPHMQLDSERVFFVCATRTYAIRSLNLIQTSEELFSVDPFAPSVSNVRSNARGGGLSVDAGARGTSGGSAVGRSSSSGGAVGDDLALAGSSSGGNNNGGNGGGTGSSISFAPAVRHDIGYQLRAMDDAGDEAGIDNGQDEEDASEQDELPSDGRERALNRPVSSNIDDEVLQDPLRNDDDNAQVNYIWLIC